MTHYNRSKNSPCRTPTPEEVRQLREQFGLTIQQFAKLTCSSVKAVERWESGERTMHGGLYRLARIELGQSVPDSLDA